MEALMRQKMSLQEEPIQAEQQSQQTILEVCGAFQNGPFQQPVQRVYTSATSEISTGGQTIPPLTYTNHNISLLDQGVLYNMKQTMFCGLIRLPYVTAGGSKPQSQVVLKTIRNVFAQVSWNIGNISNTTSNHEYLGNMLNAQSNLKKLKKMGDGLLDSNLLQQMGASVVVAAGSTIDNSWVQVQGTRSGLLLYQSQGQPLEAGYNSYIFAIPLAILMDLQVPNGVLYCGLGQSIKVVLRNVASNVCLANGEYQITDTAVADLGQLNTAGYQLSKLGLIKVYTKLDQNLEQKIQSVSLQLPIYKYQSYPIYQISGSNTALFNVGRGDRIKRFLFSINPLICGVRPTGTLANENIVTCGAGAATDYSTMHYPMAMVPGPIFQISMNIGGMQQVLDMNTIQLYQRVSASINNQERLSGHPLEQQLNYVYAIDLTRFEHDVCGSAGLESNVAIQIQIYFRDDSTISTLFGQRTAWSSAPIGAGIASLKAFQIQSFLEYQNMKELKYGIYQ